MIVFNAQNHYLLAHLVSIGTQSSMPLHRREVLRPALRKGGSSLILIYNHPSGDPTSSREDTGTMDGLQRHEDTFAISPQLPEHNRELIRTRHLTFEILTDRGNEVRGEVRPALRAARLSAQALPDVSPRSREFNGDASWTLPMPARFVIDRGGVIRMAESDADDTTRPEP